MDRWDKHLTSPELTSNLEINIAFDMLEQMQSGLSGFWVASTVRFNKHLTVDATQKPLSPLCICSNISNAILIPAQNKVW